MRSLRTWLFATLFLLLPAAAAETRVSVQAVLPDVMEQGGTASASFSFQLLEDDSGLTEGVWFLNVIEPIGGGEVRQVSSRLFSSAREDGSVFRRVFSTSELAGGLSTVLEFELRRDAPPGEYLIALQLYSGTTTNPSRVDPARRVHMQFLPFRVTGRGG